MPGEGLLVMTSTYDSWLAAQRAESREAAPGIPAGCLCAYTWHPAAVGRLVRNGPLAMCPADHSTVDAAAT